MNNPMPLLAPIYLPGQEPMPAGTLPEEREEMMKALKWQKYMLTIPESCPWKVVLSGGTGESVAARQGSSSEQPLLPCTDRCD